MQAEVAVSRMFAAGILPSIIITGLFFGLIALWAHRNPEAMPTGESFTLKEKLSSLKSLIGFLVLFVFMLWGILSGFFSPSEGGAVGAAGALLIMIVRGKMTPKVIWGCLKDSAKTTCMIFLIIVGANYFGTMLAMTRMPAMLASALVSPDVPAFAVIWIIVVVYLILGTAIDSLPVVVILTPIFMPIVQAMGWDPIWFGIITLMCMFIGLITPPTGIPVYIMSGMTGVPLMKSFKGCLPFLILLILTLALFMYFPRLSTWLPSLVV